MPTEYETLVAALKLTDIPFAEHGWQTRPENTYGVVALDFEAGSMNGDGLKRDRSWSGSVDVFFRMLSYREEIMSTVEEILETVFGDSWELNSLQHEHETGLFHVEWTFSAIGTVTAPTAETQSGGEA